MSDVMPNASPTAQRFLDGLHARAALNPRTILFPEATDFRVVEAVMILRELGSVRPILVRRSDASTGVIPADTSQVLDPLLDVRTPHVVAHLLARRGRKGLSVADAERLARDPLYFANALVAMGEADGCVAGAAHTTADVLRAAIWTIGPTSSVRTVSSAFYMVLPDERDGFPAVLTFTDCAVVPEPTAQQLSDIARAAAADRRRLVGDEPRVAFLSYSTAGSADGPSVSRVREAVAITRRADPSLAVAGELQIDAALVPAIARRKAVGDDVAGRANVLVFPSLDAGNIAYKLVQYLGGAIAIGPVIQGLARPCSDLSRGATSNDIVHAAVITALQADVSPPVSSATRFA